MKPVHEMTALDLLDAHCDALEAENERLRAALERIARPGDFTLPAEIAREALSGDPSVSQPESNSP